uniref:Uncharacterized protein n=1 Tax=Panagrolaimus sp. JU765 TaxID=591449 RepID=A0AC34Q5V5_9BILA
MLLEISVLLGILSGLAADFVKSPSISDRSRAVKSIVKRGSNRFLVDEIGDEDVTDGKPRSLLTNNDDYTDFNNKPVVNRVSQNLKQVTYEPILPTYSTPKPSPRRQNVEVTDAPVTAPPIDPRAIRRTGFFFQHYPYDKLHRFYQLNPRLQFVYPREYENVDWTYPIERTPYYHQRQFYNLAALGYYGR